MFYGYFPCEKIMKTKPTRPKQNKETVSLDAHPDVLEMFTRARNEIKPRPTKVQLFVEALREYLPKILKEPTNKGQTEAKLTVTPQKTLSEAELEAAKKLSSELEKPIKRKKKRQ